MNGDHERDAQLQRDAAKVRALRETIPATGAGIYLDTATRGPLPAETATAMSEADDWELRTGRAGDGRAEDVAQRLEEARAVVAALLVADPAEIVITHGVEDALARLPATAHGTPAVVVDHVDPNTGTLNYPADLRESGKALFLDATLSAGAIRLDVAELSVDAVVFSVDRWLLGPEAIGALWLNPAIGRIAQPEIARTALLGLGRSVGWLEMYVGLPWLYERGARLARRLRDGLAGLEGVTVATPAQMATSVCFGLTAWPTGDALDELRRRVFAIISATPNSQLIRASVAWFNTDDEIDRLLHAVAEIAAHTPETLPRRPTLILE